MRIILIVVLLALCVSCSENGKRSQEEIVAEFGVEVELANDCVDSSECQIIHPECPLGACGVAVNKSKIEELKNIEDKLYAEIEREYGKCNVLPSCSSSIAECRNSKCEQVIVRDK